MIVLGSLIDETPGARRWFDTSCDGAIERPDFNSPDLERFDKEGRLDQYGLFVGHMLFSLDEALRYTHSPEWREVVRGQIARHADYLRSPEFDSQRSFYSDKMIAIIDDVCADPVNRPN